MEAILNPQQPRLRKNPLRAPDGAPISAMEFCCESRLGSTTDAKGVIDFFAFLKPQQKITDVRDSKILIEQPRNHHFGLDI